MYVAKQEQLPLRNEISKPILQAQRLRFVFLYSNAEKSNWGHQLQHTASFWTTTAAMQERVSEVYMVYSSLSTTLLQYLFPLPHPLPSSSHWKSWLYYHLFLMFYYASLVSSTKHITVEAPAYLASRCKHRNAAVMYFTNLRSLLSHEACNFQYKMHYVATRAISKFSNV